MGARGRGARKRRTQRRQAQRVITAAAPVEILTAANATVEVEIATSGFVAAGGAVAEAECVHCANMNTADATTCANCGDPIGAPDAASFDGEYDLSQLEAIATLEARLAAMENPLPLRVRVREALVAACDIEESLLVNYDLTRGSLAERWFYNQALEAGFTELSADYWPTEVKSLEVNDSVVFRFDDSEHVYRLADGTLAHVSIRWGACDVRTAGPSVEAGREAIFAFRAAVPASYITQTDDDKVPVTFWADSPLGPHPRLRRIDATAWEPILGNYSAPVKDELERLMGWHDGPDNDGALLLWQGLPGTGKTWALRALASEWAPWAEFHYITDPDAFFVSNPSYMVDVLLSDSYMAIEPDTGDVYTETDPLSKWRVLILEDTGELLSAKAKEQYGQGLSRLLNVVDGMIGQGLRVLAIVTTNDELGELHPAVLRPGRCASQIEFGPLSAEEASVFLGETVDEGGTVAELYARKADGTDGAFVAPGAACANCDHAYGGHGEGGACMADGCSCSAYDEMEPAAEISDEVVFSFVDALSGDVVDADRVRVALQEFMISTAFDVAATLPEEHLPGERVPEQAAGPAIAAALPENEGGALIEWSAVFAPEGKLTSDGRAFAPGSITWPRLEGGPLSLMAMVETSEGGHIGAKLCGQITRIWRDEAASLIRAAGTFDTGDYGQEIARLVADQTLRGVSVDLAVSQYEVGPKSDWFDEDGNWAPREAAEVEGEPSLLDILFADDSDSIAVVLKAEIGMSTVCPFAAFGDATINVGDSLVAGANPAIWTITGQAGYTATATAPGGALTAAAVLEALPSDLPCADCEEQLQAAAEARPPLAAFRRDEPEIPDGLHITENREIYGWLALWNTCHIGIQGRCQQPPPSPTDYRYFHLGEVLCEDGERLSVGTITIDTGHAASGLGRADTVRHYDDTGTVTAYVTARDGEHGIFVSGVIPDFVPDETVELLRGAKLSGDWRKIDGALELVAILTVNVPGFPVPRAHQLVAGGEIVSLVASGIAIFEDEIPDDLREQFAALAARSEFEALASEAA